MLVLNKADTITPTEYESCRASVQAFNQRTRPIRAEFGRIDVAALVDNSGDSGEDPESVLSSRRWLHALTAGASETPEAVFTTFVYESRRPFHPLKLRWFVTHKYHTLGILRSKGFCWLASRNEFQGEWSGAGAALTIDSMCRWYSSLSEQEWVRSGLSAAARKECQARAKGAHGDRRQELVFIGLTGMDKEAIVRELDAALIEEEQFEKGPENWKSFDDPWDNWSISVVESTMMAQTRVRVLNSLAPWIPPASMPGGIA